MRMSDDVFRRLCLARELLCDAREPAPTVRAVAQQVGLSPFHFIRQFEAVFGATPHQYRIRTRLDRARDLLALRDLSVTEICLEVGFSSLGSFSDLFARRVGASPSAYRRRLRSLVQVPAAITGILHPGCFSLMGALPVDAFRRRNFQEAPGSGIVVTPAPLPNP